jgi:hypothetical protein
MSVERLGVQGRGERENKQRKGGAYGEEYCIDRSGCMLGQNRGRGWRRCLPNVRRDLSSEVFEKPVANRCAQVRSDANPALYVSRIREAAEGCPVNAIEIHLPEDLERCA